MNAFELMQKRANRNGTTDVERMINEGKYLVNSTRQDRIHCYKTLVNGMEQYLDISNGSKAYIKKIMAQPDENINYGDIVEWKDKFWIVTEKNTQNEIQIHGKMNECNFLLKFLNKKGEVVERHCYLNTESGDGESDDELISTDNTVIQLIATLDEETVLLEEDVTRILTNGNKWADMVNKLEEAPPTYKLSKKNYMTSTFGEDNGLIYLTFKKTLYNPNIDCKELGLCDCKTIPVVEPQTGELRIDYEELSLRINDYCPMPFTAKMYDAENNVIEEDFEVEWSFADYDFDIGKVVVETDTKNTINLSIGNEKTLIGKTFKLVAKVIDSNIETSVTLTIKKLY